MANKEEMKAKRSCDRAQKQKQKKNFPLQRMTNLNDTFVIFHRMLHMHLYVKHRKEKNNNISLSLFEKKTFFSLFYWVFYGMLPEFSTFFFRALKWQKLLKRC